MSKPNQNLAQPLSHEELMRRFAQKFIWWKSTDEALKYPQRVIAQVMNLGGFDDFLALRRHFGDDYLRDIMRNAHAGQFDAKSWHYWHYLLQMCELEQVPALPERKFR